MNNRGQITVFFTLILGILIIFTFTALEVVRIHMGKIKERAAVHSVHSSIMADYNAALFERYHLLFLDPTYGTGSEAVLEEKIFDYLNESLNGGEQKKDTIYEFQIEDIAISDRHYILENDMEQVKKQIVEYETTGGFVNQLDRLKDVITGNNEAVCKASLETEEKGIENPKTEETVSHGEQGDVRDPRETLKNLLRQGVLGLVMPDHNLSSEFLLSGNLPSEQYRVEKREKTDTSFTDIKQLKKTLREYKKEDLFKEMIEEPAVFVYIKNHFSSGVHPLSTSKMKCEMEYILEGKGNDLDNMEATIKDMIWLRMPVNYAYLLSDLEKKAEAGTVAMSICVATGTEGLTEVVRYLLLGCWAYAESICDVRELVQGKKIPYVKDKLRWKTDLSTLVEKGGEEERTDTGLTYEDYVVLLLAKQSKKEMNDCYSKMLDVMELNIREDYPDFSLSNCVGGFTIQGRITMPPHFIYGQKKELFETIFEEEISYVSN